MDQWELFLRQQMNEDHKINLNFTIYDDYSKSDFSFEVISSEKWAVLQCMKLFVENWWKLSFDSELNEAVKQFIDLYSSNSLLAKIAQKLIDDKYLKYKEGESLNLYGS